MTRDHADSDPEGGRSAGSGVTRRQALRRVAMAVVGGTVLAPAASRAGVAPDRQDRRSGRSRLGPLGVQLYTLRQAMAESVERTLDRVAGIGYREVEFAGYFDRSPDEVRRALDAAGLTAPSAHVGVGALDDWSATLEAASVVGHDWLVIPSLPPEMKADLDAWRRTAERFEAAGREARARGLGLAFHNHADAARPVDGVLPLDLLLQETSPDHVSVQADVYWLLEGGTDPVTFLERWPGRIPSLHVKDRAADGSMVAVGEGIVEWPAVLSAARRAGARHLFVEHDRPADPFGSVRASYRYLSDLELS